MRQRRFWRSVPISSTSKTGCISQTSLQRTFQNYLPSFHRIEQFTSELAVPTHSAVVQPLRPSRLTTSPTSPARVNQDLATHFAKETNPDFSGDVSPFDGYDYVTCDASQSHTHAHPSSTRQQELSKRAAYIRNHAPGASHKAKLCDPICVRGLPCDTPSCSLQPALALHRDPYNVSPQSSSHSQTTTTVAPPHQTHGIQSSAFSDIDQRFAAQPKSPSMSSLIADRWSLRTTSSSRCFAMSCVSRRCCGLRHERRRTRNGGGLRGEPMS